MELIGRKLNNSYNIKKLLPWFIVGNQLMLVPWYQSKRFLEVDKNRISYSFSTLTSPLSRVMFVTYVYVFLAHISSPCSTLRRAISSTLVIILETNYWISLYPKYIYICDEHGSRKWRSQSGKTVLKRSKMKLWPITATCLTNDVTWLIWSIHPPSPLLTSLVSVPVPTSTWVTSIVDHSTTW